MLKEVHSHKYLNNRIEEKSRLFLYKNKFPTIPLLSFVNYCFPWWLSSILSFYTTFDMPRNAKDKSHDKDKVHISARFPAWFPAKLASITKRHSALEYVIVCLLRCFMKGAIVAELVKRNDLFAFTQRETPWSAKCLLCLFFGTFLSVYVERGNAAACVSRDLI